MQRNLPSLLHSEPGVVSLRGFLRLDFLETLCLLCLDCLETLCLSDCSGCLSGRQLLFVLYEVLLCELEELQLLLEFQLLLCRDLDPFYCLLFHLFLSDSD